MTQLRTSPLQRLDEAHCLPVQRRVIRRPRAEVGLQRDVAEILAARGRRDRPRARASRHGERHAPTGARRSRTAGWRSRTARREREHDRLALARRTRKYRRSEASPVSGTTRGDCRRARCDRDSPMRSRDPHFGRSSCRSFHQPIEKVRAQLADRSRRPVAAPIAAGDDAQRVPRASGTRTPSATMHSVSRRRRRPSRRPTAPSA